MKIDVVFGTRPELIKLSPVIKGLRDSGIYTVRVINTGQHREMLNGLLSWFEIQPDVNLAVMKESRGLDSLTANILTEITEVLSSKPDLVLVQGDTTTAFASTLASFYQKIPVGHVEAGLRTFNKFSPWPEEMNRVLVSRMADFHFAPTALSQEHLISEGISPQRIFVTGNTVIDALNFSVEKVKALHVKPSSLLQYYEGELSKSKIVLITGHRRESFGEGFQSICRAIVELAKKFRDVHFIYPVHLNPNVQEPVSRILGNSQCRNIKLVDPLPYEEFVSLMLRSHLILTDSGGIQEEAPTLGKPVLVMRENTERPEGVQAGSVRLTGTDRSSIVDKVSLLLTDEVEYRVMAKASNPYGDGKAAERILNAIQHHA